MENSKGESPELNIISRMTFLTEAIKDTQGTIRVVDRKVKVLFIIILLPITAFESITAQCLGIAYAYGAVLAGLLTLAFFGCWLLALWTALRTLRAIENPVIHIKGDKPSGVFYSGDLFKFATRDLLFHSNVQSLRTVDEQMALNPVTEDELVRELNFEHMQLAYIRALKLKRLTFCYVMTTWIVAIAIVVQVLNTIGADKAFE